MAVPKIDHVLIARHTYKVWSGASLDQIQAVDGIAAVTACGGELYVVTLDPRFGPAEVLDEIGRVGADDQTREKGKDEGR